MYYDYIQPLILREFMSNPTRDAFQQVLLYNTGETDNLDFKEVWIDKTKLAKHILAIANSGGGAIIIGVKQNDDGSAEPIGLEDDHFLDKADVDNKLEAYLPKWVSYRTEDYIFPTKQDTSFAGKKFQVLFIEYDAKYVPYSSIISRGELKYGAIYIRQGTKTVEATNEKLIEIIFKKVRAGSAAIADMTLEHHLEQLRVLYGERHKVSETEFIAFLDKAIQAKQEKIYEILHVQSKVVDE